jgi:hypothetical protein
MSSLPKQLNYSQVKPLGVDATPEILRFRSQNQSYKSGDTIRIEIPTGRSGMHLWPHSTFLEGKLNVNFTSGGGAPADLNIVLDQCIYSCFKRYRLLHGSEIIEDQLHVNKLYNSIYDLQKNEFERNGDSISLLGDVATNTGTAFTFVKANTTPLVNQDMPTPQEFAFVLPSLIGSLASTAIPLGLMGSSSLYLELELDAANVAFFAPQADILSINSFTISDIYLNCKISQLPSSVETLLVNSTNGLVLLPAVSYKGELKTISTGSSFSNEKFAFNLRSIKNFIFFNQNQDIANGRKVAPSCTTRSYCGLQSYYLTFNGIQYPSQEIATPSVQYMNLLRAFDGAADTNFGGILTKNNYTQGTGANTDGDDLTETGFLCRSLFALDLDRYAHSSDILVTGSNTTGQNVNLVQRFGNAGVPANLNVYGFVMHDVLYELSQGLLKAAT